MNLYVLDLYITNIFYMPAAPPKKKENSPDSCF